MRQVFASLVQLVGLGSVAAAGFMVSTVVGMGVTGVGFVVVGLALERDH